MKRIIALFFVALMAACTAPGTTPSPSFDQTLAYSYGALATVRTAAANGITAHTITPTDALKVQVIADQARTLLDTSRTLHAAGDDTSAAAKLALVSSLLLEAQNYVPKNGVAK